MNLLKKTAITISLLAALSVAAPHFVDAKTVCHVGAYGAEVCEEVPEPVLGVHAPVEAGIADNLFVFGGLLILASGGVYALSRKLN